MRMRRKRRACILFVKNEEEEKMYVVSIVCVVSMLHQYRNNTYDRNKAAIFLHDKLCCFDRVCCFDPTRRLK